MECAVLACKASTTRWCLEIRWNSKEFGPSEERNGWHRYVPIPKVPVEDRLLFMPLPVPGLYRCVARYGCVCPVMNGGN